jgi:hypothetical protein
MTLGEELRRKYALTSLKAKGEPLALLAINETLEAAAEIAEQGHAPIVAAHIRSLKWADEQDGSRFSPRERDSLQSA